MANTFGGFVHTSPLSSLPHDPHLTLASNCVRDCFGPAVQTVFDALQKRGGSATLAQLVKDVRFQCRRVWNEERERLVLHGKYKLQRARGPSSSGYIVEAAPIRAGLLVLLQHDIVSTTATSNSGGKSSLHVYTVHPRRARIIIRYPRFVEYVKKAVDEIAAALIETLVVHGKTGTVDAVLKTVNNLQDAPKSDKYTQRQAVVEAFRRLVEGGFVTQVDPISQQDDKDDDKDGKQVTLEDPAVVSLLNNAPYKTVLPRSGVWRINVSMFHQSIRAFCLGRLIAERYGHRVQSAGSIVTAALKLQAFKEHSQKEKNFEERVAFTPQEIVPFLPKPVQQAFEKKAGGQIASLSRSLVELGKFDDPVVLEEVEEAQGHPAGGKYQIIARRLVEHLRERSIHQLVFDAHGDVAARVCSVLRFRGHLEADAIANSAMVPVKDTREVLHRLYRAKYVSLLTLQQGKNHNPASMVFLWNVDRKNVLKVARDNVCLAMTNLRLRRQHEVAVGKEWIERAKEAGETDENEHADDKNNYNKFCQGLERLDSALMQLDETLMPLFDF